MRHPARSLLLSIASLGAASGCAVPADPYLGTADPSGWDALYGGGTAPACRAPRSYLAPNGTTPTPGWYYLGHFTTDQLDLTNALDPTRALPAEAYQIDGCAPEQGATFDPRLDNFETDKQYPVFAQNAPEPTGTVVSARRYRPFVYLTKVQVRGQQVGCNDVRGERTLLDRGGWDRATSAFTEQKASAALDVQRADKDKVRAGQVTFKDWPLFSLATPLMRGTELAKACPYNGAKPFPMTPGDPAAPFRFANQGWYRGLLTGYLDGGDVPVHTSYKDCLSLFEMGKACQANADCGAGVCAEGRCIATSYRVDTGASCRGGAACPTGTTCTMDAMNPMDPLKNSYRCTLSGSLVSTGKSCAMSACDAAAGEVCVSGTCRRAPWPVCPKVTDVYVADAEADAVGRGSVTVGPMGMTRSAEPIVSFSSLRGSANFSPVCRLRRYDSKALADALAMNANLCKREDSMVAPRPLCTAQQLIDAKVVLAETELSFVHCMFVDLPK